VQADKEMQVREVTTGQFGSAFVEITAGLKEGERVVRVPHEVIRRADAFGRP
jgi:multidrug efflux pump subunit AcrA (membrane-fusion protein)